MMRDARLGEVVVSMKNGLYKPASEYADDGTPCLRMYNIDAGSIVWRDIKRMRVSAAELEEYGLREGDLLVNRVNSRELVGKAAFIPSSLEPSVFESKNIRVRLDPSKALPKFINYQLLGGSRHHFAGNAQQVVGMASISQKQLADFPIVLAGLDEQRRIVAEIEMQFSRLDEAVANLKHVKANVKRYKAAVLKAAVEGNLVATEADLARREGRSYETGAQLLHRILQSRAIGPCGDIKVKKPIEPTVVDFARLPDGWTWASLDQLCPVFVDSPHRTPKYGEAGYPALGPRDVVEGNLVLERARLVGEDEYRIQVTRRVPRAGDVVYSRELSLGWGVLVPQSVSVCLSQGMCLFRPDAAISAKYFLNTLNGPFVRKQAIARATGSAHPHLNLADVKALVFPLPPLHEQLRITAQVERLSSSIHQLESDVANSVRRSQALMESTLRTAFAAH